MRKYKKYVTATQVKWQYTGRICLTSLTTKATNKNNELNQRRFKIPLSILRVGGISLSMISLSKCNIMHSVVCAFVFS